MTLLYFILLIGVLIFVHELGHFVCAKLFDVKVLRFSLGFGPRALGFRRGETDYMVAWLPLGGYVKMLGQDPTDEVSPRDEGRAFHQKPLWQRYIIVFAGPVFNLIFPTLIYFVFYASQSALPPSVVGKVFAGRPAAEAGLLPGDRIVAIDGDTVRYWSDLQRAVSDSANKPLRFTISRDGVRFDRYITPAPRVTPDELGIRRKEGRIGVAGTYEPAQVGIPAGPSPARRAGLKTGDLLTSVNGQPVHHWSDVEEILEELRGESLRITYLRPSASISQFADLRLLAPRTTILDPEPHLEDGKATYHTGLHSAEFFVATVEEDSPAARMGLEPGVRVVAFDGEPLRFWQAIAMKLWSEPDSAHSITWIDAQGQRASKRFRQKKVTYSDEYGQEQERYIFGADNRLIWRRPELVPIEGRVTYALSEAVRQTGHIVAVIATAFVHIFRGAIPRDTIGGPVMLYHTAGVAARQGWDRFVEMMALISINLAILNLLPIPILDGGHIMFFTVEAIKRRPLSLRAREIASYVGLMLLVSLMAFAFKNDIVRYWFK